MTHSLAGDVRKLCQGSQKTSQGFTRSCDFLLDLALSSDVVKGVRCSLIPVAVFFSTLLLYSMKNKENVVDSVVKVTIDHTSESKQDVIQASQKLLHFLAKTTSSNSIVKKHKGKKYCCIAREKHFDSSNVTSSLNVCVEMLAK